MAQMMTIQLAKGESPNLGFRLQGGVDFAAPLVIQKVNGGSPAERSGLIAGDAVIKINNTDVYNLRHKDAQDVIIGAGPSFTITVQRGGSTWKPSVTPTGNIHAGNINNISPVTKTSLAAKPQASIGAIGTGHNVAAKPFLNGTANGGPKLVNKQYNSPVGLYSEQSIAETISAQSEVLSTGALGVNFKKNEKNYDATKSAVYHMLQEAENEPRDSEPDYVDSGVITSPHGGGFVGLKHVQAPENKPAPPTPQLPPGQNVCADCERLIVGVFVRIKDKNLHVECFKCSTCGASLKNVGYYNINNKLYCDVHAKLAAKTNPPAPNLVPVTVPPGGKVPAGTISAALSSHSLPSPAPLSPRAAPLSPRGAPLSPRGGPLSPSTNTTAAPFQSNLPDDDLQPDPHLLKSLTIAASKIRNGSVDGLVLNGEAFPRKSEQLSNDALRPSPVSYRQFVNKASFSSAPRPFSSVIAPLSPSNYNKPLPRSNVGAPPPLAPAPAPAPVSAPTPGYITAKPGGGTPRDKARPVQNIVWPPPPDEPLEPLPTASPLYFPPPSNVKLPERVCQTNNPPHPQASNYQSHTSNCHPNSEENFTQRRQSELDYTDLEDYTNYLEAMEAKMSLCSSEVCNITGRRSSAECADMIADHLETQMLVESVMKSRPKSPPPLDRDPIPPKQEDRKPRLESISEQGAKPEVRSVCPVTCDKSCCNPKCESCPLREPAELKYPHDYEKSDVKIVNAVPKKYESPMVAALSTAPSKKYNIGTSAFGQIPQKHSSTAFADALSIAPQEPVNVLPIFTNLRRISLPEETVPYFPPEHPIVPMERPPPKKVVEKPTTPFVEALKIAPDRPYSPIGHAPTPIRKKPPPDPLFKDVPKPQEKMSMLAALTTAPDREYSPLIPDLVSTQKEEVVEKKQRVEDKRVYKPAVAQPYISLMKDTFESGEVSEVRSSFPPVSSELQGVEQGFKRVTQSSQEMQQFKQEIREEMQQQVRQEMHQQVIQEMQQQVRHEMQQQQIKTESHQQQIKQEIPRFARQAEEIIMKKPLSIASQLHKDQPLPSYQASLQYDEELQLPHHKNISKLIEANTKSKIVPNPRPLMRPEHQHVRTPPPQFIKPIVTVEPGTNPHHVHFQPVHDDFQPPSCNTPQRLGRPSTPSAINKPPPAIPYYQQNLVATEFLAPEINVFDPKSPGTSRSPSPCMDRRPASPFRSPTPRPRSPAAGPPPNPLKVHQNPAIFQKGFQIDQARDNVTSYIPQHQAHRQIDTRSHQDNVATSYQSSATQLPQYQSQRQVASSYQADDSHIEARRYEAEASQSQATQIKCDTRVSTQQQQNHEQAAALSMSKTLETSGNMQIQRTKKVTEEFEHMHKEKVIEIQKGPAKASQPFKHVNAPVIDDHQGIIGLHVTNPHPLVSPFQDKAYSAPPPLPPQPMARPQIPAPPPPAPHPPSKIAVPLPQLPPAVPERNQPNVPPAPSVGTGGAGSGRQSSAVFAPKRGRGVLNVGGMVGNRIPLCGACNQQIRGPFITALGKIWCPDHFICATPSCKRPLQDIGFVEERGQLHCEYCFEQYLAPNCAKCNQKIKGDCLKAIGKNFHPECFNCAYCGKLFGNSPFFLEDGLPYCETDWNEMFTTKCFACGFPVEAGDRWVEALNNNYHSQCFNCTMCKKNLEGQSFFAKGGRPFCKNHAR